MFKLGLRYASRSSRRLGSTPGTVIRTKNGKKLESPSSRPGSGGSGAGAAHKPSSQPFAFGHFSGLKQPPRINRESSARAVEKVSTFDELRIFPTVRMAMQEEIKIGYNLAQNTYVQDKNELHLKPSPVQVAAIKKLTQPRLSDLKKLQSKQERMGYASNDVYNELAVENELSKLKVFTIAAETGSGKTWSYLAPMLSSLKEEELEIFKRSAAEYSKFKNTTTSTVRSLILLPTHELVEQVYDTIKNASACRIDKSTSKINPKILQDPAYREFLQLPEQLSALNLNVLKWGAGEPHTKLFDDLKSSRIDVLVTTPLKLLSLSNINKLNNTAGGGNAFKLLLQVSFCVIDEADTLMDKSWVLDTTSIIKKIPKCKDLVFCSATIPKEFNKTLTRMFPGEHTLINVVTPSLHKIPKQIHLKVLDAELSPYNGSKTRCLAQALYAIHKDGTEPEHIKRILVFVNQTKDVEPLRETLIKKFGQREQDIIGITGKDSPSVRSEKITPFLQPAALQGTDGTDSKIKVLIATDLLARGLNFIGIKNVILMDLPNTSVDLVHRVGRTGRMRQSGRVFVIIDKKTGKSWIKGLPKVIKKGIPLG